MRVMFTVQGEGRGHLTQALTVYRSLSRRGHDLVGVVVGGTRHRRLPDFFTDALPVPVTTLPSPGFVIKGHRGLNTGATALRVLLDLPTTLGSVRRLGTIADELEPDVVINFFEPLTGLARLVRQLDVPVVSIAHQFMFLHPGYHWPRGRSLEHRGLRAFVRLVGHRSWRLALSLEPAPDRPAEHLVVGPPLLRPSLTCLQRSTGDHYLVYLLNHGYLEDVRAWHARHPHTTLHCFCDRPEAPEEDPVAPGLTVHRLNGEKFLSLMAGCRAVVATAGFETVAEAAWLGKPVFLVPVEGHLEQALNALETERLGLGIAASSFDLDGLARLPDRIPAEAFRDWTAEAETCLDRVLGLATNAVSQPRGGGGPRPALTSTPATSHFGKA